MNTFTKIVEAQNGTQAFRYDAQVTLSGVVYAESEGDAGGIIDSQIKAIKDADTWEIGDIALQGEGSPIQEGASAISEAADVQYGAGLYLGMQNAMYDRWAVNFNESAKPEEMLVQRHLNLNRDAPYVFRRDAGNTEAIPVGASRLRTK